MKSKFYRVPAVALSVLFGATLAAALTSAATTISTNIQTDGTLSVTGQSNLTGNVGIGTTTPPQPLSVIGNAYVSGILGVGTANPATNLDGTYGVEIEGNAATSYTLTSFRNSGGAGNITLNHERGTQASPLPVNTGDVAGTVYFQVLDPLTSQLQEVGDIQAIYNGNDGSTRDDGALVFHVNSSADEQMRIVTDNNDLTRFGFGTAAPAATFDFQTGASPASGNTYGMRLQQTLVAAGNNASLNALYINPTFNNNGKSNVAHNGLIVASGNVGFGTTTPATQLQVSSGAGATTTVTVGELGLSSSKACVNMNRADGGPGSFYISAGGAMVVESNYCR